MLCRLYVGCRVALWAFRSGFFFFKQKTAYEMRISDWSSDVCSSDLIMTLIVEEGPGEFIAIVEAAALQPGEAETTEDRRVHGSAKLSARRQGSLRELVRTVGPVGRKGHEG